jgi:hypothetical protein
VSGGDNLLKILEQKDSPTLDFTQQAVAAELDINEGRLKSCTDMQKCLQNTCTIVTGIYLLAFLFKYRTG